MQCVINVSVKAAHNANPQIATRVCIVVQKEIFKYFKLMLDSDLVKFNQATLEK